MPSAAQSERRRRRDRALPAMLVRALRRWRCSGVRILLSRQLQRAVAHRDQVALLDRQRPVDKLLDVVLAGLLAQLAEDGPVADLAGLGHGQELEAVELVGVLAEIGLHHLARLALGFASLLFDRGLLAVALGGDLQAAAFGLLRLLAHRAQLLGQRTAIQESLYLLRRLLRRSGQPGHLGQLLLERRQIGHVLLLVSWACEGPADGRRFP